MQGKQAKTGGLAGALRAYAAIVFLDRPAAGALILAATFTFPNIGASGLLGAATGWLVARLLRFSHLESGLPIYNSLLVGLALGAYYELDARLALLIVLAAAAAVFASAAIADLFWRLGQLPALSAPFVFVALPAVLAAHGFGGLARYLDPLSPPEPWLAPFLDRMLAAFGASVFTPHPWAGALMLFAVAWISRYLALLAALGFTVGYFVYFWLSAGAHPALAAWNGFNFSLTAMAVGGIFTTPSWPSLLAAAAASAIAALFAAATEGFFLVYGLPVMALPFLAATLLVLLALERGDARAGVQLMLHAPDLPERNRERQRLAAARGLRAGEPVIAAPFFGTWSVYQGFDGAHTHQGLWRHALDFHIVERGRAWRGDGRRLEDYYCFGLPVRAPVDGVVARIEDEHPDLPPGQADLRHNWGNFVLIRADAGFFVLLAHLKQKSVRVRAGQRVQAGKIVAACGSSGRSPQPHLHLQLQATAELGAPTLPFRLGPVLHGKKETALQLRLGVVPREQELVGAPKLDLALAEAVRPAVGTQQRWQLALAGAAPIERELFFSLDLWGTMRIETDRGASARLFVSNDLLAAYDREGPNDPLLDAWLLALGLTPFASNAQQWRDAPPARLFPRHPARLLAQAALFAPGITSHYERIRRNGRWLQRAEHALFGQRVRTQAEITQEHGCQRLWLIAPGLRLRATLVAFGNRGDLGVPGWSIPATTSPRRAR